MPFDLSFEELPAIAPRGELSQQRRSILRRAIGSESIERAKALPGIALDSERGKSEDLIQLSPVRLLEDLKHDWLAAPIAELLEGVSELATVDLSDDRLVGGHVRRATWRIVQQAEAVVELVRFMDQFAPSILDELVRPIAAGGLSLTVALIKWMTSSNDDESTDQGRVFDLAAGDLRGHLAVLCALPFTDELVPTYNPAPLTAEEEFGLLMGLEFPQGARRWIDVLRHFEGAGYDLCELGSRQLRYFGEYRAADSIWSRNFFALGLRIGQSAFPLLAHRAAFLAWQLFGRALAADEDRTLAVLHRLFDDESLWMIGSQDDYFGALSRYLAGDKAAIVEAYSDVAEGTLRRYGSLVVALERIAASGETPEPLVLESIAEVESQLVAWKDEPLPALILRFLERGLRNAEAHANVVIDAHGTLQVRLRDGSIDAVSPNHAYGRTTGLRSLLDGVDIAMNHASIRDKERHLAILHDAPMPPMSATMFERIVQQAAEEHTRGSVSGIERSGDRLTMTYHGHVEYEELRTFVNSLMRLLGPILPTIHILDDSGDPIEVFRPPRRRGIVGRNAPCPCGSGKKYKRCHGA